MATRAERRREARAAAKRRDTVLIAGNGIIARSLGQRYEAVPHRELPEKQPGVHRWVAIAAYVLDMSAAKVAYDPDRMKYLDHENLMTLAIACYDCELALGIDVDAEGVCTGEPT